MDDTSESKYLLYPQLRGGNTSRYINKNQSLSSGAETTSVIYNRPLQKNIENHKTQVDLFYVYVASDSSAKSQLEK